MTRAPCCENEVKKGPWTPEEDELLVKCIVEFGEGNWSSVPKKQVRKHPLPDTDSDAETTALTQNQGTHPATHCAGSYWALVFTLLGTEIVLLSSTELYCTVLHCSLCGMPRANPVRGRAAACDGPTTCARTSKGAPSAPREEDLIILPAQGNGQQVRPVYHSLQYFVPVLSL